MTKLQLHVVCAVVAAARAIDAANDERRDLVRHCGGWAAGFEFEDDGMSVGLTAPEDLFPDYFRTGYAEFDAPLRTLTGDKGAGPMYGVPVVESLHITEEKIFAAIACCGLSVRELPRAPSAILKRLVFDWRNYEPTQYSGLTRAEISALPADVQIEALKANPGEAWGHYDMRCPKCKHRYAVNCLARDADTATKCPRCEPKEAAVA